MGYAPYERLSAIDATFLAIENPSVHMHVGAVAIFDARPLRGERRAIDMERIEQFVSRALHETPRFRQKLTRVPFVGHPVWVDDERFNLAYHLRHTALPAPGSVRQLKRLAGRIFSQKLDRGKPLWEMWLVDGLKGNRFAMVLKAHHCMVDGIAGIDLLAALLRLEPDAALPEEQPWIPHPQPTPLRLLTDEVWRRASTPLTLLAWAPALAWHLRRTMTALGESALALAETVGAGIFPATSTPLNPELGPYRRFDWTAVKMSRIRRIRARLGGTVNDVVLATVGGAVRRFLDSRGMRIVPETRFRVMVPVSVRQPEERGVPGNRVVNFLARLPIDEPDPVTRLLRTSKVLRDLKQSRLVKGAEVLEEISDWTATGVVVEFVQLAASNQAYNMVVTNVPGPSVPLYLLGARLREIYPLVPLFTGQGLGIALFSYDRRLWWGFNADWDALPDLHAFVEAVDDELATLAAVAETVTRLDPVSVTA